MQEFKAFLLRGNLVDMAVGIVIGLAFAAVVTALVADLITPLIAAIFGKQDFSSLTFTINGSHVPLRRLHQRAARVRARRDRAVLLRDQAGERSRRALPRARGRRTRRPQLPRVPERDPDRGDALLVLHDGGDAVAA